MSHSKWQEVDPGIWIADSGYPGTSVAIMTDVHGDEGTSRLVKDHLMQNPPPIEEGSLTLISANPEASAQNKHYIGSNMNRGFSRNPVTATKPPEAERLEVVLPHLERVDALLDIHDTSSPCDPFIICERNSLDTALRIGRRQSMTGLAIAFGFSEMEPGGSDDFMYKQGKEGLCFESGDMSNPKANLPIAIETATRFLIVNGLVEGEVPLPCIEPLMIEVYRRIMSTEDFKWAELFNNFQILKQGQLLATSNGIPEYASEGDVILFPARKIVPGDEACEIARVVNS